MDYNKEMEILTSGKDTLYTDLEKCMSFSPVNPMQAYHIIQSIAVIEKIEDLKRHSMPMPNEDSLHVSEASSEDMREGDFWGDADLQARQLFENLEKHYAGFWKCVAEYQKNPTQEIKAKMLQHFEMQLQAHDMMSMFVRGNCPVLCDEIKVILANWMAKKKSHVM